MIFDIHSHILPAVDDGSDSIETSVAMLEIMKSQNITDVMATPHFYAYQDNFEKYQQKVTSAFTELKQAVEKKNLPNIYLGSEILYFKNISNSSLVKSFCLNKSNYILIELSYNQINQFLFDELIDLKDNLNIIPIIAHIERYYTFKGFNRLIDFVVKNRILTQINASSVIDKKLFKVTEKLIKKGCIYFIATDAHSVAHRPPRMDEAMEIISKKMGNSYSEKLISNSQYLLKQIKINNGD